MKTKEESDENPKLIFINSKSNSLNFRLRQCWDEKLLLNY